MKNIRMTRQIWFLIGWSCLSSSGCLAPVSDGTSSDGEDEEVDSTKQAASSLPSCDECDKICEPYTGHYKDLCIRACEKTCVKVGGPVCGNHVVETGEQCDDGNTVSGDGCSSTCQTETPAPVCGNGKVESGEQCDDGNTVNGDGCSSTCQTEAQPVCGNGKVETGEQCDDGNTTSGDGCSSTCKKEAAPVCGNGFLETGEQCDDGNTVNGDGCSSTCKTETPAPVCGNNKLESGEQCDDGNTANDDGCSSTCKKEVCGDGIKQTNEQCDDGNTVGGDGCEANCTLPVVGPTCDSCRATHCRDFQGVDLVAGCFQTVNGDFGADPTDPKFIQQCVDIVQCARQNHCAYGAEKQAAGCYCGSATIDACAATGPATDAPCVAAWQAGARSTVNADVQVRFTDLAYPTGWAYFILDCDRTNCNTAAAGDCTKP